MRGASSEALGELHEELHQVVSGGVDGHAVAADLLAAAEVLRTEPSLRRVLTDVSVHSEAKTGLVRGVFAGKVSPAALELLASAVSRRWAAMRDLSETLELLGVTAVVRAAERDGSIDTLEDELFTVSRMVTDSPELRDALSDPKRSVADKKALVHGLLEGKASRGTLQLVDQAVGGTHRTVGLALEEYQRVTADQRERLVALVRVARPLNDGDTERLRAALTAQYGRQVHLNELVDESVLGGVRVEIGDDVIDGTVASRLDDARRRLAG